MEQEVKDDLYASMGEVMMYVDNSILDLKLANFHISELYKDKELPRNIRDKLKDGYSDLREQITMLTNLRKYIDGVDLTT